MKRILLSLIILHVAVSVMSQDIGEAFYIYRNDEQFHAFFRDEVDSIAYSYYDSDSVYYDEIVTQLVYTPDSIYWIPLSAIDSVSFVTPETKYQNDVIVIEGELRNYVFSSEGLTIIFRSDTPSNLLPHIGDKLVTTELSAMFTTGFAGKVESVVADDKSIVVTCSPVGLDEVFKEFLFVSDGRGNEMNIKGKHDRRSISYTWEDSYSPGEYKFPLTPPIVEHFKPAPRGDLAFQFGYEVGVGITPTYRWKTVLVVSPILGTTVSIDLIEEYGISATRKMSGAIDWTHDFTPGTIPIFALAPFVYVYGELGAFLQANATVSMDQQWKQTFRYTYHYEASSRSLYIPRISFNGIRVENKHGGNFLVEWDLGMGIYIELGVAFMAKWLLSAGARAEVGVKAVGDVMLYKKDMESALHSTDVYKKLQENDVHLSCFWKVGLQGQLLKWGFSHSFKALTDEKEFARFSVVPDFSDVKLIRDKEDPTILQASAKVSGNCLPQELGFTLFEQEILEDGIPSFGGLSGSSKEIYASYFDMSKDKRYEVYPTVKLFGLDALTFLAEPSAKESDGLCPDDHHPHAIDLGLPSGTKWCCCNVGASTSEGYGGYYAWGETSEKSVYNDVTYKYFNGQDTDGDGWIDENFSVVNIGSDIAGTSCDVARVRMGAPWRMPTIAQQQELMNNCSRQWTQQNGVNGLLVTGPNGGQIFLPAAGYRWNGELDDAGTIGDYWSSSLRPDGDYCAYDTGFNSYNWSWDYYGRYCGHSVRAVCP